MAESEVDLDQMMKGAVTDTEKEIFQYGVSGKDEPDDGEPDENPDRSIEEMGEGLEGQHEPGEDDGDDADEKDAGDEPDKLAAKDADDKSGKPDGKADDPLRDDKGKFAAKEGDDKGESDKDQKPGQPPSRVLAEANERRRLAEERAATLEAERKAEREEFRRLEARLDGVLAAIKPPAKAEEPPKAEPADIFENPQGFVTQLNQGFETKLNGVVQQFEHKLVGMSMKAAHRTHGETFENAFKAVTSLNKGDPQSQQLVQRIWRSDDPGEALVAWHRQQETLRRVGADPDAYEKRIAEDTRKALMADPEFRKQLLEDLKAEAAGAKGGSRPRAEFRAPKSLNGASGGRSEIADPALYDNSERAVFESAFTNDG